MSQSQQEVALLSERNTALKHSLEKMEAEQTRAHEEYKARESDQNRLMQETIMSGHQKFQEFVEKHTNDLYKHTTKEMDLKNKLAELETRNKLLTGEVKRLEEEIQVGHDKLDSLGRSAEEVNEKSCDILGRYERGELSSLERTLVMKVHESAQLSHQRVFIEKNNEIARVRRYSEFSEFSLALTVISSEIAGSRNWNVKCRICWRIERTSSRS